VEGNLLPRKIKGDEDNAGIIESQRGTQAHPMMMMRFFVDICRK
jgi:hypothetical protein